MRYRHKSDLIEKLILDSGPYGVVVVEPYKKIDYYDSISNVPQIELADWYFIDEVNGGWESTRMPSFQRDYFLKHVVPQMKSLKPEEKE